MDVNIADLEPKNVDLLRRYVTDEGRILPRQRYVKRARQIKK